MAAKHITEQSPSSDAQKTMAYNQACNVLALKAGQLAALTTSMVGDGFENFSSLADNLQHDLLALVSDLALEINKSCRVINGFDCEATPG